MVDFQTISIAAALADLPSLNGDLTLEVFTHPSLVYDGMRKHPIYGDSKRLAELGEQVINVAVTAALFDGKNPLRSAEDIAVSICKKYTFLRTN